MKHKELDVWKIGIDMVKDVYQLTALFPDSEKYGLSSQMRRCAVSIPSNIAEGAARHTPKEFNNFLYIARGSLSELDTQFIIAEHLEYWKKYERKNQIQSKMFELSNKLNALINSIKSKNKL